MKKIVTIISLSILTVACNKHGVNDNNESIFISIIYDQTDSLLLQKPQADYILQLYGFDKSIKHATKFKWTTITDKRLGEVIQYSIPDIANSNGNSQNYVHYRDELVDQFYNEVTSCIRQNTKENTSFESSSCYHRIAEEINFLSKQKAAKRILIIYSDLRELSELYDSYHQLLQSKQISLLFNEAYPIEGNLQDIELYFVFQPRTKLEEQAYLKMLQVYRLLLQPTGAKIYVCTNTNQINIHQQNQ